MTGLRILRSGSSTLVLAQWTRLALNLVALVALSQLLDPRAFGLYAMVVAFAGVASIIGDFGLSLAAIAQTDLDQNQRSKLFAVNLGVGLALTLVVGCCAPLIADFYGEHALVLITVVLAPTFALNAAAAQFKVELNVKARWARLALTETAGATLGLLLAIVVAALTHSYWALVVQPCTAAVVQLALAVGLSGWRPSRPNGSSGVRQQIRFGRNTLILQAFTFVTSNVDNILVGHSLGSVALGNYSRAYQLAMTPVVQLASPLTRVMLPNLSRARRDGTFVATAAQLERVLAYAILAPMSLMIVTAEPAVRIFLGPNWGDAPRLLQILAAGASFIAVSYIYYWVFLAADATGTLAVTEGVSRVLMIIALFIVVNRGSVVIAVAVALSQVALMIGSAIVADRKLGVSARVLGSAAIPAVVLYGIASLVAAGVGHACHGVNYVVLFVIECGTWVAAAAIVAMVVPAVRRDASSLLRRFRQRAVQTAV